jgi:hypothetical protein
MAAPQVDGEEDDANPVPTQVQEIVDQAAVPTIITTRAHLAIVTTRSVLTIITIIAIHLIPIRK